jgi:nitrite reductase (NADH) large subunit
MIVQPQGQIKERTRLVLVGNGMAGMRAIDEILARAPERFEITVFGAEPHGNYDRIQLSPVLAGEKSFDAIITHDRPWYDANGVKLRAGEKIIGIDRAVREVISENGTRTAYDILLLATGSTPIILPIPGTHLPGIQAFRTIADVEAMLRAASSGGSAVVIGGGLLGLEAAYGLKRRGMDVTILHLMPHLMERQLDPVAGAMLKQDLERRGMKVITKVSTGEILGTDRVTGVALEDGREIAADLVVMAIGIRPNIELARTSGLAVNRGILADARLATSDRAIFALGECAECCGQVYGLVAPLFDMARVLAERLCDRNNASFEAATTGTRLKVTGIDMFSAGNIMGDGDTEDLLFNDRARGVYKRLILRDDELVGAVLYGEVRDGSAYLDLIKGRRKIDRYRDELIFSPRSALAPEKAARLVS